MTQTTHRQKLKSKDLLTDIFQQDIDNISATWENFDRKAFETAVRMISKARHIYIVAIRESSVLGEYLRLSLNKIFPDVRLISTCCSSEIPEQLLHVNEKDVVIGISFPNYSALTLKAMEFANRKKAAILVMTDDMHCPVTMYSSCTLLAAASMSSVSPSLTAAMSYLNALIAALYIRHSQTALENMDTLNAFWDEYPSFGSDDLNPPGDTIEYEQLEFDICEK